LRSALRVLEFVPDTQIAARNASDGSGADKSHMDSEGTAAVGIFKLRHKIYLGCIIVLCALFFAGESDRGQDLLLGKPKPNETHWEADDRYMGAGLAPLVYCLVPAAIILIFGGTDFMVYATRRRTQRRSPSTQL
jgi:hypothetical protein